MSSGVRGSSWDLSFAWLIVSFSISVSIDAKTLPRSSAFVWFNKFRWKLPTRPIFFLQSLTRIPSSVNQVNGCRMQWHPIFSWQRITVARTWHVFRTCWGRANAPHWLSCDVFSGFENVLQHGSPLNSYHGPIDQWWNIPSKVMNSWILHGDIFRHGHVYHQGESFIGQRESYPQEKNWKSDRIVDIPC